MMGMRLRSTSRKCAFYLVFSAVFGMFSVGTATGACLDPPGDVDQDAVTTVVDVQCTVLVSLWELAGSGDEAPTCIHSDVTFADRNCNGSVNVVDVNVVAEMALGFPLSEIVDDNGDQCIDSCEAPPICGDGECSFAENCGMCPEDCGACEGSCCYANDSSGCEDTELTTCVCGIDTACCEVAWDDTCVVHAHQCAT